MMGCSPGFKREAERAQARAEMRAFSHGGSRSSGELIEQIEHLERAAATGGMLLENR
jgi:hypothetical protein